MFFAEREMYDFLVSVAFHVCVFFTALEITRSVPNAVRIMSLSHSWVVSVATVATVPHLMASLSKDHWIGHEALPPHFGYVFKALSFSIAYFAVDLIIMATHASCRTTSLVVHHTLIGATFTYAWFTGAYAPVLFAFLGEEISTIFLNLRELINKRSTVLNVSFALSFFLCRTLGGSFLYAFAVKITPEDAGLVARVMIAVGFATRLLNLFWLLLIVRAGMRASSPRSKRSTLPRSRESIFLDRHRTELVGLTQRLQSPPRPTEAQ